jgi:hypothetical protein
MILLSLQIVGADEDREVGVADFERLNLGIEPRLDVLPYGVAGRLENVAAGDLTLSALLSLKRKIGRPTS